MIGSTLKRRYPRDKNLKQAKEKAQRGLTTQLKSNNQTFICARK